MWRVLHVRRVESYEGVASCNGVGVLYEGLTACGGTAERGAPRVVAAVRPSRQPAAGSGLGAESQQPDMGRR